LRTTNVVGSPSALPLI